jgi:hypothetical protein
MRRGNRIFSIQKKLYMSEQESGEDKGWEGKMSVHPVDCGACEGKIQPSSIMEHKEGSHPKSGLSIKGYLK